MSSASHFYRFSIALAVAGSLATLVVLSVALSSIEFVPPSLGALASACQQFFLPDPSAGALLALSLTALGVTVLILAARSLARQLRGHRRFISRLSPLATARIAESPVTVFEDPRPQAFCAGYLHPRIYLSSGALRRLSGVQLEAVVAHERYHVRRRDPLRILLARVLGDCLFFIPVLRRLVERYGALSELAADEEAVRRAGASTLASALLTFGERGSPAVVVGIARERVDHLLGEGPRWELPISLLAGSLVAIAALAAVALGTAPVMSSASPNLPMLLAQTCMAAMAALAILIAGSAVFFSKSIFARSRT
jgi:Zn-dependent protease with chaperone function